MIKAAITIAEFPNGEVKCLYAGRDIMAALKVAQSPPEDARQVDVISKGRLFRSKSVLAWQTHAQLAAAAAAPSVPAVPSSEEETKLIPKRARK